MAFTGVAVVEQIADGIVRVTDVQLAEGAAGVLVLAAHPAPPVGAVVLPAGFKPQQARWGTNVVGLEAAIDVSVKPTGVDAGSPTVAKPIYVIKNGDTPETWTAMLSNGAALESGDSGELEIYVKFHE